MINMHFYMYPKKLGINQVFLLYIDRFWCLIENINRKVVKENSFSTK